MTELFYALLKASFHGSIVILAVIALRLLLKKAPKSLFCLLWLLAGLRLVLPFEIESSLSLQPDYSFSAEVVPEEITSPREEILNQHGDVIVGNMELTPNSPEQVPEGEWEEIQTETYLYKVEDGAITGPLTWTDIAVPIWILGMAAMLIASLVSYWKLKRRVREACLTENGCFECPGLETAFVLGFFAPRIYLPDGLTAQEKRFIYDHENTHIARGDHWSKLLGYCVLALHWFNPLVWMGYHLLCRDIELACDEHVVRNMDLDQRKAYSAALLSCGSHTARLAACPVAFGESNPKKRILNVLNYKRPGFWISLLAVIAVAFVGVCLLTSPETQEETPPEELKWNLEMQVSDVTPTGLTVKFVQSGIFPGSDRARLMYGTHYTLERFENGQWTEVEMLPHEYDVAWTMEAYLIELNSTNVHNVDWGWLYGDLPAGHYRIVKDVDLSRTAGDLDSQIFYAEFDIGEKTVTDEELVTQCREAMLRLKNSAALHLYIQSLDDPNAVINIYMKSSRGWLFQYRRPQWDYTYVSWLRYDGTQYLYGGDRNEDGIMTAPYYWQVEQNPESHNFQLPYPFDLAWESIELTYEGSETENSMNTVTLNFPLYGDAFRLTFDPDKTLCWFDVGETSGEPEAATTRFYVLSTEESEVEEKLSSLYQEAVSNAGRKPGAEDEAFYHALFNRKADGAYATMWISDLYAAFYTDPEGFVRHLSQSDRAEEILNCMKYEVAYNAPYYFDQVLSQLEQSGAPSREIFEKLQAFTSRDTQAQQQEDDLNDQTAWLAKCAAALEFYQAHGIWSIGVENKFSGDAVLKDGSSQLWYIDGQDWLKQGIVGNSDFTQESWVLMMDGEACTHDICVLHNPANGEGFDTGWVEADPENYRTFPMPWPLEFDWDTADIRFVDVRSNEEGDMVRFTVSGSPLPGEGEQVEEYLVTLWLFGEGSGIRQVQLEYTSIGRTGDETHVCTTINPYAGASADVKHMIYQCHDEAIEHIHDGYDISCTVEGCTNPDHRHDDHHDDDHH